MLTKVERLILVNQYLILEKLYPRKASSHGHVREGLELGYQRAEDYALEPIRDCHLSAETCTDIVDVLNMHRALDASYRQLRGANGIDRKDLKFQGFDGNEEPSSLRFVAYICSQPPKGRYREVCNPKKLGSRTTMWPRYRAMLREWRAMGSKGAYLSEAEIRRIVVADQPATKSNRRSVRNKR